MKYLIAVALLLAALPAAAEEQITCAELAARSDRLVAKLSKEINEKEAAGDKVGVSLRKTTIGIQGKHFRESCVDLSSVTRPLTS